MNTIFQKEFELIAKPINELVIEKLNKGFKNRQGRELHSVEEIFLNNIVVDEDKSSLKETVYITSVRVSARIWVKFADARSSDNVLLSISKELVLVYDFDLKEYIIKNPDEVILIDITP